MKAFKLTIQNLGIDNWIYGLTGLGAIVFGVLGFFGKLPVTPDQTTAILMAAIGLLMTAVVALSARRQSEILDLKSALGMSEIQVLKTTREFGLHLIQSIGKTKRFVLDSSCNDVYPGLPSSSIFYKPHAEYNRLLYKKVVSGGVSVNYIEVIFHKQSLEGLVFKVLLYHGFEYYVRHFDPPQKAIPIINMMSFDDDIFYIGGFHAKTTAIQTEALYIRDSNIAQMLKEYWVTLWNEAIPLNEGKVIDWDELKRIGTRLGMSKYEFDEMVSKAKERVQQEKRQLRS
ncbi:MAG: hypothetical protein Fur0017_31500 [Anaerolineales bacterium]